MSIKTWFIQRAMRRKLSAQFTQVAAQPLVVLPREMTGGVTAYALRFKAVSKKHGEAVDGAALYAPQKGLFMLASVTEGGTLPELSVNDRTIRIRVPKQANDGAVEAPPEKKPDNKFNL